MGRDKKKRALSIALSFILPVLYNNNLTDEI